MNLIRISKEFRFEAAHALFKYDGLCQYIHGHSYRLIVTVIGKPITDDNNPKNGMVIDFGDFKKIVKRKIVDVFDHSLILPEKLKEHKLDFSNNIYKRTIFVNYQPTSENLLLDFAGKIKSNLPMDIKLHSMKLYETATSYAEWYSEDNSD
ncbi:MAG: 6-carboxytetrahydropterin synthase [Marinilabiliales bacterium]